LQISRRNKSSKSGGRRRVLVFKMRRKPKRSEKIIDLTALLDAEGQARKIKASPQSNKFGLYIFAIHGFNRDSNVYSLMILSLIYSNL
jgi:hypothetical protein